MVEASTLTGLRHGRKKVGTAYELLTEYAELPEDGSVEYFRGETMVLFKPKVGGVFCVCEAGERGWVLKRVVGELNDIKWKKTNSGECK